MTYYDILEVQETASDMVIHMAYKALIDKYHLEKFDGDSEIAEIKLNQLNMAYNVLSDKEKRKQYDEYLVGQRIGETNQYDYDWDAVNCTYYDPSEKRSNPKKKLFVCMVVMLLFIVSAISLHVLFDKNQNIEKIKDSVVMIEVYNDTGDLEATGSGFCAYRNNWIVTNFHVIEGAKKIVIIDNLLYSAAG